LFTRRYDNEGSVGELLIDSGADDTIKNIHGLTPFDGL
jgi:hypothetical protein